MITAISSLAFTCLPALGFTLPACSISEVHFACSVDTSSSILSAEKCRGILCIQVRSGPGIPEILFVLQRLSGRPI